MALRVPRRRRADQVIDVFVSPRRDLVAARRFFSAALAAHGEPKEVVTDLAQALEPVVEELIRDPFHNTEPYANNRVETDRSASTVIGGHALMQNLRRGHYELRVEPRLTISEWQPRSTNSPR